MSIQSKNSKKIAFTALFAGIALFGISMVVLGATLPLLKTRFDITDLQAGSLFAILPLGLLLGSVSFGPVADRYGYRWVLSSATLLLSVGFFGIAHAGSMSLLRIFILLFGAGGGAINGASSALISDLSEGKAKIINLNWLGAFFAIGAFTMPFVLSLIRPEQTAYVVDVVAVLSLLVALLFAVISYPEIHTKEPLSFKLITQFLNNRLFMLISFFLFFQSAFEAIVNNWTVSFLISGGFSSEKALMALSASVLGMISMRLLVGSLLKNLAWQKLVSIALALLMFGFLSLQLSDIYLLKLAGVFALGAGLAPGFPVFLGLAGELFRGVSATSFSFVMVIALTGNIIINYFTGVLSEAHGMSVFPYVILFEVIAMTALFLAIRKNKKHSE